MRRGKGDGVIGFSLPKEFGFIRPGCGLKPASLVRLKLPLLLTERCLKISARWPRASMRASLVGGVPLDSMTK